MSGYKRVSFYELCRLCASNTQKEKTHIFQEEGRKIQLQNKIQTCLALTVNENDFLPKVVCAKCLRNLETCFGFRQECVRSESMLSTYFKNFRYTEDFKRSGKVYIKDIKPPPPPQIQQNPEISTSSNISTVTPLSMPGQKLYTLQLPTIVSNPNLNTNKIQRNDVIDNKLAAQIAQNQFAYNLNLINTAAIKTSLPKNEMLSNVVVNSNGEVINIAQMGDFETILNHGNVGKSRHKSSKRSKDLRMLDNPLQDDSIVKIDLTDPNNISPVYEVEQANAKYDKLPHIKTTQSQPNKYTYSLKVDDKPHQNPNQTVIFPISEYNQNFNNFSSSNNTMYTQSNLNIVNNSNSISSNANVVCNTATNVESSSISINVLNQSMQEINQSGFTNVISSVTSNMLNSSNESDNKTNVQVNTISDNNNSTTAPPAKVHVCDICSRGFKRREHLYQHVKLHTGFRPLYLRELQQGVYAEGTFIKAQYVTLRSEKLHVQYLR
ncbi:hypothetical protein NQ314_013794 [Rhamnusium bicolor]|uniref:Uncharacterized protein n=1 Tax=Rhamnusium bicolor TaxID=1586634 RepID=A0AAV8X493_9CUCU|nr:hypothetical protein NQ314_013794 [Rhamnusium bicolor]